VTANHQYLRDTRLGRGTKPNITSLLMVPTLKLEPYLIS